MHLELTNKGFIWSREKILVISDINWTCPKYIKGTWTSKDGQLIIKGNQWYIRKGTEYDGCSNVSSGPSVKEDEFIPVKSLTDKKIGILWLACLIHDVGYRNLLDDSFPFTKSEIDSYLKMLCESAQWKYSKLYYCGAKILGWFAIFKRYIQK